MNQSIAVQNGVLWKQCILSIEQFS